MIGFLIAAAVASSAPQTPSADPCRKVDGVGVLCTEEGFTAVMRTCAAAVQAAAAAQAAAPAPVKPIDGSRSMKAFLYGVAGSAMLVSGVSGVVPPDYTATRWTLNVTGSVSLIVGLWLASTGP